MQRSWYEKISRYQNFCPGHFILIYSIIIFLKRIIAIFFLAVYLVNLTGYSLLFSYFINSTDEQMVEQLDNGSYDEASLTEIKVAVNLPYTTSNKYERWDGTVELNGTHYNYVKRKIHNDTLYLLCIPNQTKTALSKAKSDYAANLNDNAPSSNDKDQKSSFAKKNVIENDYDQYTAEYNFYNATAPLKQYCFYCSQYTRFCINTPWQPPKFC